MASSAGTSAARNPETASASLKNGTIIETSFLSSTTHSLGAVPRHASECWHPRLSLNTSAA
jgi:hypothetical protein